MATKSAQVMKDSVCGMKVDPEHAAGMSEHQGQQFYFCSDACKDKFDKSPDRYAAQGRAAT